MVSLSTKDSETGEYHHRLSTSDSSGEVVLAFTESNYEDQRISPASKHGSRSGSRRGSSTSTRPEEYSIQHIYGDLDQEKIDIRRTATRNTILSELVHRTQEQEDVTPVASIDLEKGYTKTDTLAPEGHIPIKNGGEEFYDVDPELVAWSGPDDPDFPRNWPRNRKVTMIGIVSFYALVAPMSSSMLSPAMSEISESFHIESQTVSSMVVSIQILAWALGPLIIAPLSEHDTVGRKIVLDVSVWLSFFFNLGCAFSQNTAQIMIFRFIGGLFGCVPLNVGAGVISDLYEAKSRNTALAGYALAPLLGPVLAPVIAGFIVQAMKWRWVFYVLCMFNAAVAILGTCLLRETYTPTLLRRRAKKLRIETGNPNLHTIYEIADGETMMSKITLTMTRPVKLLFTHPMIVGLGSLLAFTYGYMYLLIVTFPTIFSEKYGFSKGITGLMYLPMGIGFVLGVVIWTYSIGKVYNTLTERNGGVPKPEFRLPCTFIAAFLLPIGLIWFGWSAEKKLHWIMPGIGSALFAIGFVCIFQTIQSYLIDMNPRYAASSVAAAALFRSLFGFSFPLFANKMYDKLGYGWANTMCAMIALLLGVPFPIFCYIYGERVRKWADKKFEKAQLERDQTNLKRLQRQNLKKAGVK